jgi:hypothetical protein
MNNRLWTLVGALAFVVVLLGLPLLLSREGSRGFRGHRYFAPPGSTQENWRPMIGKPVSEGPEPLGEPAPRRSPFGEEDRLRHAPPAPVASPVERVLHEAQATLSTEDAIERLQVYLEDPAQTAGIARIYAALGALEGQKEPPCLEAADAAFDAAYDAAGSPTEMYEVALSQARFYVAHKSREEAIEVIREIRDDDDPVSVALLELILLDGQLSEDSRIEEAETAYLLVRARALENAALLGQEGLDLYRRATLNLARLYRKTNRIEDAEAVTREYKLQEESF